MSKEISGTIVSAALQKGLLINAVRPNMIRFMPPLNVSKGEIDEAVEILEQIFTESDNQPKLELNPNTKYSLSNDWFQP